MPSRCPVRKRSASSSRCPATRRESVFSVSVLKYRVTICTGNVGGSGTDASVFLNIIGELGDTGERLMVTSKNNVNKFEKGNVRSSAGRAEKWLEVRGGGLTGFTLGSLSLTSSTTSSSSRPCVWAGSAGSAWGTTAGGEAAAGFWIK